MGSALTETKELNEDHGVVLTDILHAAAEEGVEIGAESGLGLFSKLAKCVKVCDTIVDSLTIR